MSGYGNYTPYRARWSNCFKYDTNTSIDSSGNIAYPNAKCNPKVFSLNTKKFIVNNVEIYSKVPIVPIWQRYSALINLSTYRTGGQRLVYVDIPLNEYGSYSGAPASYGQPPRNTFN